MPTTDHLLQAASCVAGLLVGVPVLLWTLKSTFERLLDDEPDKEWRRRFPSWTDIE